MPSVEVVERPELAGFGVEWADANRIIVSRGDALFDMRNGLAPQALGRFPQPAWRRAVGAVRMGQRALRYMFYNVLPLANNDLFVTFGREVAVIRNGVTTALRGLERPFRVLRAGCALARDGSVVFGEYVANPERRPIRLYRYWPGADHVEIAHTFESGAILHVHGVYADPFTDGLWCLTGDVGTECRILYSTDGFRTHEVIGMGDESWRAVSMVFAADAVYYGMDAEFTQNFIYRIDRRTGARDTVQAIEGPVYYSASRGSDLFFAVTAELCPSQQGDFAALWHVDANGGAVRPMRTFQKDRPSPIYFMPGTLDFARTDGTTREILFRTTSVVPDNSVFAIR